MSIGQLSFEFDTAIGLQQFPPGEKTVKQTGSQMRRAPSLWQTTPPSLLFEGKQVVDVGCQLGKKKEAGSMAVWEPALQIQKDHQRGLKQVNQKEDWWASGQSHQTGHGNQSSQRCTRTALHHKLAAVHLLVTQCGSSAHDFQVILEQFTLNSSDGFLMASPQECLPRCMSCKVQLAETNVFILNLLCCFFDNFVS